MAKKKKTSKKMGILASKELAKAGSPIDIDSPEASCVLYKRPDGSILETPVALYNRCRKEIGMSDEMIASHPNAESLLQYANGIHPKSNPDARIKEGLRPEPMKFEDNMPDSFTLESILEAKFVKTNRDHFDRANLQAFLRRINRRYGPHQPVRIVTDRSFKVAKRELVTKFTIYYTKG